MAVDVAMFLPNLGGGGAERVTVTLANGLAERGLSIDLCCVYAKGPHLVNVSPKVRAVHSNSRPLIHRVCSGWRDISAARDRNRFFPRWATRTLSQ